jgi:nitroreductase
MAGVKDDIQKILEVAVHAPSGENAQPWRFEIRQGEIAVFNIPERDQSLYNYGQLASYVAHGALIENILIASSAFGYKAQLNLCPQEKDADLVAIISLEKGLSAESPVYRYIQTRCTNRKPYKREPLSKNQLVQLISSADSIRGGKLLLVQDREKINALARAGSVNEQVMLHNKFLHNFFFTHINWTQDEEDKKRIGFYIKTLELPPPAQVMFKIFRRWPIMKVLNRIGFAKIAAKSNADIYASCAGMGAVVVSQKTPRDFITGGRIMQQVWLKATQIGLDIQPLAGVLFFMRGIQAGHTDRFMPQQVDLIKNAYNDIRTIFGAESHEEIVMMFRIGEGEAPSACSSRLLPQIIANEAGI